MMLEELLDELAALGEMTIHKNWNDTWEVMLVPKQECDSLHSEVPMIHSGYGHETHTAALLAVKAQIEARKDVPQSAAVPPMSGAA